MTPSVAIIDIRSPHWRGLHLWLPLFLLWIPLLLLSPLIVLVVLGCCVAGGINPWKAFAAFWSIACALRGTDVHVRTVGNTVHVRVL